MRQPPEQWKRAMEDRLARLGALVTRRHIVADDLTSLDRQIVDLRAEVLSLERTTDLAAQLAAELASPTANGQDEQRRTDAD